MKIVYGKALNENEQKIINLISLECGVMKDTAKLLLYRNIDTVEKAKRFLNPGKHGFHNPYLLSGMESAVERIKKAKKNNENVVIFGDYDADGICAVSVLYYCLKIFGISAQCVIPERVDGYGINLDKIFALNEKNKIDLVITVDCGISEREKIEVLMANSIDVIVTDHHEPPEDLPDCTLINPKINGQEYPFNGLCGAGVAYKLSYALIGDKADYYLDYVALATVADSMDLIDENRDIVVEGLKLFNSDNIKLPFKYILGDNNKQVTAQQSLAYVIAPRINAGGRMGDANCGLKLFLSNNELEIFDLTAKLNEYNVLRQVECDNIYREAKDIIIANKLYENSVIIVGNEQWGAGFIGIVAARLVEDYCKPVIVFAGYEDLLKGSARSVDGVNIYDAICATKEYLNGFGGHSQAAGLSLSKQNLTAFDIAINNYLKDKIKEIDTERKIQVEWEINAPISTTFAKEIQAFEPFGTANKKPYFCTSIGSVRAVPIKAGSQHFTFSTQALEMLDFNGGADVVPLMLPTDKKVVFEINLSTFKNRESLKGFVKCVVPEYSDLTKLELYAFENQLKALMADVQGKAKVVLEEDFNNIDEYGTYYVLSNIDNAEKFKEKLKLPITIFSSQTKNQASCIAYAPEIVPYGYSKVVYLDKPMQELEFDGESIVLDGENGYKNLDKINTDRKFLGEVFIKIRELCGKQFLSVADFYNRYASDYIDGYNFIFALSVFMELKIFVVKNGVLVYDDSVKNPLTNSKVYSKICVLKG